jgi:hypothetical protein
MFDFTINFYRNEQTKGTSNQAEPAKSAPASGDRPKKTRVCCAHHVRRAQSTACPHIGDDDQTMSDSSQTRQRPSGDQSAALPLTDAATALGISENALRLRIRRQQVNAHKRDGRWYVVIDQSPDESPTQPDQLVTRLVDQSETVAALRGTIDILQADIEFLRRQVEEAERRHTSEIERRDVLLQSALGRIPALSATSRQEPQGTHPTGQGEAEADRVTLETSGGRARSWWRRLIESI